MCPFMLVKKSGHISSRSSESDPIGLFKKKLNKLLLEIQKEGSPCEWENFNTMVT